jgi:hypothetical protein
MSRRAKVFAAFQGKFGSSEGEVCSTYNSNRLEGECKTVRTIAHVSILIAVSTSVGCVKHALRNAAQPAVQQTYVDVEPGWRLEVITPIIQGGGFVPRVAATGGAAASAPDLIGYEVADYAAHKSPAGVHIEFVSANDVIDGKPSEKPEPRVQLFGVPASMQHVRLLFMLAVSSADHDMAILAADDLGALNTATQTVQSDPQNGCVHGLHSWCEWVPKGIAVRPEKRVIVHGREQWVPVP